MPLPPQILLQLLLRDAPHGCKLRMAAGAARAQRVRVKAAQTRGAGRFDIPGHCQINRHLGRMARPACSCASVSV